MAGGPVYVHNNQGEASEKDEGGEPADERPRAVDNPRRGEKHEQTHHAGRQGGDGESATGDHHRWRRQEAASPGGGQAITATGPAVEPAARGPRTPATGAFAVGLARVAGIEPGSEGVIGVGDAAKASEAVGAGVVAIGVMEESQSPVAGADLVAARVGRESENGEGLPGRQASAAGEVVGWDVVVFGGHVRWISIPNSAALPRVAGL